ncbi:MAG: fibronectin type III domain-containing protein, partial [Ignavibacteriales bacterium]|nr:fibronectin type III domain-containing protein [Ignavibacteriales bacterium]
MPVKKYFAFFMVILLISSGIAFGQGSWPSLWNDINESAVQSASGKKLIDATSFRVLSLDFESMQTIVKSAPMENITPVSQSNVVISLPFPDGSMHDYYVNESPVMAPELITQFPDVRTFCIEAKDFEGGKGRIDVTQFGFHAMLFTPGGTIFIDPYHFFNTQYYMSYYFRDFIATGKGSSDANCVVDNPEIQMEIDRVLSQKEYSVKSGNQLRTYRLALAADAEYTTFCGGTVSGAYSQMVTTINRVNSVYINDLCIKLVLVANTQNLIYTNSNTDPYTNNDGVAMLTQNQTTVDNNIGTANYDIGHVFSTGGGGIAGLGVVCRAGLKAQGVTGSSSPTGDGYDIDYVAHEMGHQFGANHTFNSQTGSCGGGNRNATTAYENGSGTTIMAYAGICGADDLQAHSDPYFHTKSIDEIIAYSTAGSGNGCAVVTATGNSAPSLTLPTGGYTIPISTPFALTASATDPDGDAVTYCWEEYDLGNAGTVGAPVGNAPIFRSFNPTVSATRYFPKLSSIIGNTTTFGEMLPTTARTLTFKCTVRDNKAVGGGVTNSGTVAYTVSAAAGPFLVTAPNTAVSWTGATAQTITWNVANTSASPVSCANVNILLSTDGGQTWALTLASNTPNDGTQSVTLPNITTTTARVKVEAVANIFFDMSNTNFTITAGSVQNTPPAAPQNLTATVGYSSVILKWNKNTEADFRRYRVYGGTTLNPVVRIDSTLNGITDTVKTISGLITGTTYYFRITAVDSMYSESAFSNQITAIPSASLQITSPNGGELWRAGTNQIITWSSTNISTIKIYYSSNAGATWQLIANNVQAAAGRYSWATPSDSSSLSKVKIVDISDSTLFAVSNQVFSLYTPVMFSSTKNITLSSTSATFETTNLTLGFASKSSGMLTVEYYPTEAPEAGTLPGGIQKVSNYFWKIIATQAQFVNVSTQAPILSLNGVSNPLTLCWLKRTNSGDPWINIGGTINGNNLVSTVTFSSFSEFAIGTTDSNSNPLPVELTSFFSRV